MTGHFLLLLLLCLFQPKRLCAASGGPVVFIYLLVFQTFSTLRPPSDPTAIELYDDVHFLLLLSLLLLSSFFFIFHYPSFPLSHSFHGFHRPKTPFETVKKKPRILCASQYFRMSLYIGRLSLVQLLPKFNRTEIDLGLALSPRVFYRRVRSAIPIIVIISRENRVGADKKQKKRIKVTTDDRLVHGTRYRPRQHSPCMPRKYPRFTIYGIAISSDGRSEVKTAKIIYAGPKAH